MWFLKGQRTPTTILTPWGGCGLSLFSPFSSPRMACVTLKRPVEVLGSPHRMESEPIVKRRRCGMSLFPTTPPGTGVERLGSDHSQSGRVSPALSRHHSLCASPLSANRGNKRAKRKLDVDEYSLSPTVQPVSPFLHATPPVETGKSFENLF